MSPKSVIEKAFEPVVRSATRKTSAPHTAVNIAFHRWLTE